MKRINTTIWNCILLTINVTLNIRLVQNFLIKNNWFWTKPFQKFNWARIFNFTFWEHFDILQNSKCTSKSEVWINRFFCKIFYNKVWKNLLFGLNFIRAEDRRKWLTNNVQASKVNTISGPMWKIQNEFCWYWANLSSSSITLSTVSAVAAVELLESSVELGSITWIKPVPGCSLNASATARLMICCPMDVNTLF